MKKIFLCTVSFCLVYFTNAQPLPTPRPIPAKSLPKLNYVPAALANSYNWWRRVNPANITYFPSINLSDLNNKDFSLASYEARTIISFSNIGDINQPSSLSNDSMIHLEPLVHLEKLLLRADINDAGIAHLAPLKNLKHLECLNTGPFVKIRPDYRALTNNSMTVVASLGSLEVLRLYYCKWVDDAGLSQLSALKNLKEMDLTAWNISDKGMSSLTSLTQMEILNLSYTSVTDLTIPYLQQMTALKQLDLSYTSITDKSIDKLMLLLPRMPAFNKLLITGDSGISKKARSTFIERFPRITLVQ
ncbi:MAG: hypothetical protein ACJ75B_00030 [Flavisolibacter sp.]